MFNRTKQEFIEEQLEITLLELEDNYKKNIEDESKILLDGIKKLLKKAEKLQQSGELEEIYCMMISLLKANVSLKKNEVLIELFDSEFLDGYRECSIGIDLKFIYKAIANFKERLCEESKKEAFNISELESEKICIENLEIFSEYLKHITKYTLRRNDITDSKNVEFGEFFDVYSGEYRDDMDLVYRKDSGERSKEEKEELFKSIDIENQSFDYFSNIDISNRFYEEFVFEGTVFENINFENSTFTSTDFTDAYFYKCNFRNCIIEDSLLLDTVFVECDMTEAEILNCYGELEDEEQEFPRVESIRFINSNLKDVLIEDGFMPLNLEKEVELWNIT